MTPIRRQYLQIKRRYPNAIVFFRLGDFYETFDEDAKVLAREMEITLTSREMGKGIRVPLAGIPYHAAEGYIARLISRGYKVAICEQMKEVSSKGLIAREVVRVITPGTVVEAGLLQSKENNYLAAAFVDREWAGLAYADITTGEFATTQLAVSGLNAELERLGPAELLLPKSASPLPPLLRGTVTPVEDEYFRLETAQQSLQDHFGVVALEAFGCARLPFAIRAAGAIVQYLGETQRMALSHLTRLVTYSTDSFMIIDPQTRQNLELFSSIRRGVISGSLLSVIDVTRTAMGGRLLRRWLSQPLLDEEGIRQRQDAIEVFFNDMALRTRVAALQGSVADIERLANHLSTGSASPREVVALWRSLEAVPGLKRVLEGKLSGVLGELNPCQDIAALIAQTTVDDPPPNLSDGGVIKGGFFPELDGLRSSTRKAKEYIAGLEGEERKRTGIKSLKVGYNRVFGYYIEVSKANLSQVPAQYIRRQTLVGGERFITPELKEYEALILNSQERMVEMETAIFKQVCQQIGAARERLLSLADALAHVDVFCSLAEVAVRSRYVRPRVSRNGEVVIKGGRHPVVERTGLEEPFVPNDTHLSPEASLIILTGPNMAGKSTYLRQVALIVLLAQIGSFVPADTASIGLVDRLFTRVGAQDELAAGRSTFMVEMMETAHILHHATSQSLIILDEIGRGTSTYDGLSIAQAIVEYIHNHPRLGAKTLFATHYHELVEMAKSLPRVRNFNVAVSEDGGSVVFLRKIVPGGADKSYGIHVARLAGLPKAVVQRAQEVLKVLEEKSPSPRVKNKRAPSPVQLSFLGESSPMVKELVDLDVDALSPLEAITKLYEFRQKARDLEGLPTDH